VRTLAIIDGEHYAPVVRDALATLPYEFVGALRVGGTEKLLGGEDYGVPLFFDLERALEELGPELVLDLSDEPVVGPDVRFLLASRALAAGVPYVGADFRFDPPAFEDFALPALAVIGTGKRVGKTAVTAHLARLLAPEHELVVVAMGRGGPAEPEPIETRPTVDDLLARSRSGAHAASDHLEIAALTGVPTIGSRRCGGGLAGAVAVSNVAEGAALALSRQPDLVLFDGSGAAIPPVDVDARILVAHDVRSGLNAYRVLISDLVLAMREEVATAARELGRPALTFALRLRPLQPLAGRRTALFTTGPATFDHLPEVVSCSRNLANRELLRRDLEAVDAEVYLVELKAAAVDVVAEAATARGAEVVLADNEVVPSADGSADLDAHFRALATAALERENVEL
jgi:cyclic 2,3-diphosphoglycerate synthetase